MKRAILTVLLCLPVAVGCLLIGHTISRQLDGGHAPAACVNGGQWQILHGWTCYPPLPAPPAAHLEAG